MKPFLAGVVTTVVVLFVSLYASGIVMAGGDSLSAGYRLSQPGGWRSSFYGDLFYSRAWRIREVPGSRLYGVLACKFKDIAEPIPAYSHASGIENKS